MKDTPNTAPLPFVRWESWGYTGHRIAEGKKRVVATYRLICEPGPRWADVARKNRGS